MLVETKELLSKIIKIRRAFHKLYSRSGLISINSGDGIHVTVELLFAIPGKAKSEKRDTVHYPVHYPVRLSKEYAGETFFTLVMTVEEYDNLSLEE